MTRRTLVALLACAGALLAQLASALACSQDDPAWFEGFLDTSCTSSTTNTQLDVLGGLRLQTNGSAVSVPAWDTDGDFDTGVIFETQLFAPIDVRTLATSGTGTAASLELGNSPIAFTRDTAPTSVLGPTPASATDNDNVDDPSAVKVGSTYVMYYSGTAEGGSGPAIFRATSSDGRAWTKQDADSSDGDFDPVLRGA